MNTERITRLEKLLNRELSVEEKERLRRMLVPGGIALSLVL
jgi:hypothetical protein